MNSTPKLLTTTGIQPPTDFPTKSYEIINSLLKKYTNTHRFTWEQFAGSWNALGYRFKACTEHDIEFTKSIKRAGSSPQPPERYIQERELFSFFVTGLATIETFCYGLYAIGSIIQPNKFPFSKPNDFRNVNPKVTAESFKKSFISEPITNTLQSVIDSREFNKWNEIRNILVHRTLPGRRHSVYVGRKTVQKPFGS